MSKTIKVKSLYAKRVRVEDKTFEFNDKKVAQIPAEYAAKLPEANYEYKLPKGFKLDSEEGDK